MKGLYKIFLLLCFTIKLQAQEKPHVKIYSVKNKKLKVWNLKGLFNNKYVDVSYQFGSLYKYDLKYYLSNYDVVRYFDDFDLGLKMELKYKLSQRLQIKAIYNLGMIKFNLNESGKIQGPVMKFSINYITKL